MNDKKHQLEASESILGIGEINEDDDDFVGEICQFNKRMKILW